MKRRFLCVLTIVMLLFSSMAVSAFAGSEKNIASEVPEAIVLVQVNNAECKMVEKMTDLTVDIKLKDGRDVINVPVERVEDEGDEMVALWLGESFDQIDAQIKADMVEFQKDYHLGSAEDFMMNTLSMMLGLEDMAKDLLAIFENYEIVINGIPEDADHEFEIETNTILITSTIVSELFDIIKELIGEVLELNKEEIANIDSFSDLINELNAFLVEEKILNEGQDIFDLLLEGIEETDELDITKEDVNALVEEMDALLAYLQSEDYTGTVFAGIYMDCECPYTVQFEIYHQYFKEVDGKMTLAGTENFGPNNYVKDDPDMADWYEYDFEKYYYEGLSTDIINAVDYVRPEFNGETYKYMGSYGSSTLVWPDMSFFWTEEKDYDTLDELYASDEWWTESKTDQLVFAPEVEVTTGLVLRYELMEPEAPASDGAVQTGDDSNMTPYVVIMFAALAVMAAAVVTRRKQTN